MAGSAYVGLMAASNGPETALVAVAVRDLPAGMQLQDGDIRLAEVVVADPQRYVQAADVGGSLVQRVGKSELIPISAISDAAPQSRLVAIPIDLDRLPPNVDRGALVDVWRSEAGSGTPVLEGASVVSVTDPEEWSGATATVVLAVDTDEVALLLAATRAGAVDITGYQAAS